MNKKQRELALKSLNRKRYRNFEIRTNDDAEDKKPGRMRFAASSNDPIRTFVMTEDFMGEAFEVLSHKEADVDLTRLRKSGHFLLDHNGSGIENNLGRIREADVDGERLDVEVEFNPHNPSAGRVEKEMQTDFRPNISVGFMRDNPSAKMVGEKDGLPVFEFGFEPFEVSSVLIPADISVGVGRSEEELIYREFGLDQSDEKHQALATELLKEMRSKGKRPFEFDGQTGEFDDCVAHFEGDPDVDDPAALCASLQEEQEKSAGILDTSDPKIADAIEKAFSENDDNSNESLLIDNTGVEARSASDKLEADSKTSCEEQSMSKENTNESAPEIRATVGADMDAERKRTNTIYALAQEDNQLGLSVKAVEEGWSVERFKAELHDVAKTGRKVDIVDQPNIDEQQSQELDIRQATFDYINNKGGSALDDLGREEARKHGVNVGKDSLVIPLNLPLMPRAHYPALYKRALGTTPAAQGGDLVGTEFFPIAPALFEGQVTNRIGVQFHNIKNQAQVPRFDNNMPAAFVGEGSSITLASGSFATDTATPHQALAALGVTPFLGTALDGTYNPVDAVLQNMVRATAELAERSFWSGSATAEPGGMINLAGLAGVAGTASIDLYTSMWGNTRGRSVQGNAHVVAVDVYQRGLERSALSGGTDIPTIVMTPAAQLSGMTSVGPVQETAHLPDGTAIYGDWSQALFFTFGVMELTRDPNTRVLSGEDLLWTRLFVDNVIQEPAAFVTSSGIDITS